MNNVVKEKQNPPSVSNSFEIMLDFFARTGRLECIKSWFDVSSTLTRRVHSNPVTDDVSDLVLQLVSRRLSKWPSSWLSPSTTETLRLTRESPRLIFQDLPFSVADDVLCGVTGRFVILGWPPLSPRPWATWWKDMTFIAFTLKMVCTKS